MRWVSPTIIGLVAISLAIVLAVMSWQGFDERSTPIAVTLAGSVATVSAALVAASRADHARVHARRSAEAAEFTASKTAALQQTILAHCGRICPARYCPLRERTEDDE